jgi:hypothetical protein
MRARATPLVGRLQERLPRRRQCRGRVLVDLACERLRQRVNRCRLGNGSFFARRQRRDFEFVELLFPVGGADREQRINIDDDTSAVMAAAAQYQRPPRPPLDAEAHHRLIDRADFFDIEGAVGQPLAVEH